MSKKPVNTSADPLSLVSRSPLKPYAGVSEMVDALSAGKCIVLADDEDRENEGDLVCAATKITPEIINFMATHARGLICLTMTGERCDRLGLRTMEKIGVNPIACNFTESIEAASGVSTGISAADRAHTIRTACAPDATAKDIVKPGHVFPVRAVSGGVLSRAGHTEAACDLCATAGLEPAAVICEIMNEDGSMARRSDLSVFAQRHGLPVGTITDLIHHQLERRQTVELLAKRELVMDGVPTTVAVFRDLNTDAEHTAMCVGDLEQGVPMVRVQSAESLYDVLGVPVSGRWSAKDAMQRIRANGCGVLVLLGTGHRSMAEQLLWDSSSNPVQSSSVIRHIGLGAQILRSVGLSKIKILGRRQRLPSLSGYGIEIVGFEEPPEGKSR